MSKKQKGKNQGFTLLELLIVMIILAILAGLGLMAFGTIQQKSRDSRRKQDLVSISKALETYYNDYGVYPTSSPLGAIEGCGSAASEVCAWGSAWMDDNSTLYMTALPQDPAANWNYFYQQIDDNSYYLFARLENELDKDAAVNGGNPSFYTGTNCDGASLGCNYVILSTSVVNVPTVN